MSVRYDPRHLIDPLHQNSAKEPAVTVDVLIHDEISIFGTGILHMFHLSHIFSLFL